MIYTIIVFFALAAILGITLLSFVLRNKPTPKGIAFLHGPLAAIGLILLIIYTIREQPSPVASTILLTIAALGGIVLFSKDITGKKVPKWLAILHGLLAVSGFIFLLIFAFLDSAK